MTDFAAVRIWLPLVVALVASTMTGAKAGAAISNEMSYGCQPGYPCLPTGSIPPAEGHERSPSKGLKTRGKSHPQSTRGNSIRRVASTSAQPGPATADVGAEHGGGVSPFLIVLIAVAILAILSAGVAFFNERFRSRRR